MHLDPLKVVDLMKADKCFCNQINHNALILSMNVGVCVYLRYCILQVNLLSLTGALDLFEKGCKSASSYVAVLLIFIVYLY